MEEKERYYYKKYAGDYDILDRNDKNAYYGAISQNEEDAQNLINLLNQQSKRIKELENKNSRLSQGIYWGNGEHFCDVVSKLKKENQQLKQQLHDLPKKIVEDIEKNFTEYLPLKYKTGAGFYSRLNTILKKYGGEDE